MILYLVSYVDMSIAAKLLNKMRNNPLGWSVSDVKSVSAKFGLNIRDGKGSHFVVYHPSIPTILTIPAKRPIKPVYIKMLIELIDQTR